MELIYMEITKKQAEEFAIKIVQDRSIDDDSFEETFQYIRDNLFYYASKCDVVELDDIADFHGNVVYRLYGKYFGGEYCGNLQ